MPPEGVLIAPTRAIAVLLALGILLPSVQAAGGRLLDVTGPLGPDDPGGYAVLFQEAYNRRFEGTRVMTDDPYSLEGAFYVFQKAAALMMADPEVRRRAMAEAGPGAWFDPDFPGPEVGVGPEVKAPPGGGRLYAPSYQTLERIRELFERQRQARRSGDDEALANLDSEFRGLLRGEADSMDEALQSDGGDSPILGFGRAGAGPDAGARNLDPGAIRDALGQEDDDQEGSSGGSLVSASGSASGPMRAPSQAVTDYLRRAVEGMNQPKTYQERWQFEMSLEAKGFELSTPDDPRKGVPSYNPYQAFPPEVFFGGASNLSSRPRNRRRP